MKSKIICLIFFLLCFSLYGVVPPEIPDVPRGVIWCPLAASFWNDAGLVTNIVTEKSYVPLEEHGYRTYRTLNKNSISDFLEMFRDKDSNPRDYIELHTHGGDNDNPEWLAVEFYSTRVEAELRIGILINNWPWHSQNIEVRYVESQGGSIFYTVSVNAIFISDMLPSLNNAISYVGACYSSKIGPTGLSLVQSFLNKGAMTSFGWDTDISTTENADGGFCIFRHMSGRVVSEEVFPLGQRRNKTAREALNDYQSYYDWHPNRFHLGVFGNSSTKFYNSPRIVGLEVYQGFWLIYRYGFYNGGVFPEYPYWWDYPGDLSGCPRDSASIGNQPIQVKILFSSLMDPGKIQVEIAEEDGSFSIPVSGYFTGGHIFDNDVWEGACDFSEWSGGGNAVVRVGAEDAFEGDINARLDTDGDGNSDEEDTNHKFWVALPPRITDTDPPSERGRGRGAEDVDIYKKVSITFNKTMDTASVDSVLSIMNLDDTVLVEIKEISWDADNKTMKISVYDSLAHNDTTGFKFCTNYMVMIKGTAEDTSGVTLDGDKDGKSEGSPADDDTFSFETRSPEFELSIPSWLNKVELGGTNTIDVFVTNNEQRDIAVSLSHIPEYAPDWVITLSSGISVPANETAKTELIVENGGSPGSVNIKVTGKSYETEKVATAFVWASEHYGEPNPPPSGCDENYSISNPNMPSPWILNPHSKIGIFLSGYAEGMGHLLGKYKISTAIVLDNFDILGASERQLSDLDVLIIPTGGLIPYHNLPPFRNKLQEYTEQGGTVICFTQSYGDVFEALPGSPTGYGWREDKSCHAYACYLNLWDTFLSGQNDIVYDGNNQIV